MSANEKARLTDSILRPGRGYTPTYGLNDDSDESAEVRESKGLLSASLRASEERVWTIALFSFIACVGSFLIGMFLGYSTNTLAELDTIATGEGSRYGIPAHSHWASIFGVSVVCFVWGGWGLREVWCFFWWGGLEGSGVFLWGGGLEGSMVCVCVLFGGGRLEGSVVFGGELKGSVVVFFGGGGGGAVCVFLVESLVLWRVQCLGGCIYLFNFIIVCVCLFY